MSRFLVIRLFGGSFNNNMGPAETVTVPQPKSPSLNSQSSSKIWASSGGGIILVYFRFTERSLVSSSFILSDIIFESQVSMEGEQERRFPGLKKTPLCPFRHTSTLKPSPTGWQHWGGCSIHNFCLSACWKTSAIVRSHMCDLKYVISWGYVFASQLSPRRGAGGWGGVHLEHPPRVTRESPLHALKRAQHRHPSYYVTTRAF